MEDKGLEMTPLTKRAAERQEMLAPSKVGNLNALGAAVRAVNISTELEIAQLTAGNETLGDLVKMLDEKQKMLDEKYRALEIKVEELSSSKSGRSTKAQPTKIFMIFPRVTQSYSAGPGRESHTEMFNHSMWYKETIDKKELIEADAIQKFTHLDLTSGIFQRRLQAVFFWMPEHMKDGKYAAPADMLKIFSPEARRVIQRTYYVNHPEEPRNEELKPHQFVNAMVEYMQDFGLDMHEAINNVNKDPAVRFPILREDADYKAVQVGNSLVAEGFKIICASTTTKTQNDPGNVARMVRAVCMLYPPKVQDMLLDMLRPETEEHALAALTCDEFLDKLFELVRDIFEKHRSLFPTRNMKDAAPQKEDSWTVVSPRSRSKSRGRHEDRDRKDKPDHAKDDKIKGGEEERGGSHPRVRREDHDSRGRSASRGRERGSDICTRCWRKGHRSRDCVACDRCFKNFYKKGASEAEMKATRKEHNETCPNKDKSKQDIACGSIAAKEQCPYQRSGACHYKH